MKWQGRDCRLKGERIWEMGRYGFFAWPKPFFQMIQVAKGASSPKGELHWDRMPDGWEFKRRMMG
jgi:hypothetical protein